MVHPLLVVSFDLKAAISKTTCIERMPTEVGNKKPPGLRRLIVEVANDPVNMIFQLVDDDAQGILIW